MPPIKAVGLIGLFLAAALWGTPGLADRAPNPEERARVEGALRNQGFTRWGEIELDDGVWEVDDAYAPDGRKYDLKLNPETLAIIERDSD